MDPPMHREYMAQEGGVDRINRDHAFHVNSITRRDIDVIRNLHNFRTGDFRRMPNVAYDHTLPLEVERHLPRIHPPPGMRVREFPAGLPIHRIAETQRNHMLSRRRDGKGKGKNESTVLRFNGDNSTCTICLEHLLDKQQVYRLQCNHLFHESCWDGWVATPAYTEDPACPNCRGPGVPKALFPFVGPTEPPKPPPRSSPRPSDFADAASASAHSERPSSSGARSATVLVTSEEMDAWTGDWQTTLSLQEWLVATGRKTTEELGNEPLPPADLYHTGYEGGLGNEHSGDATDGLDMDVYIKQPSKTKIVGRNSMLVDLGSRINIIGLNTEREFAAKAAEYGHKTTYRKRSSVLKVNGVGVGHAPCLIEATLPLALQYKDEPIKLESYKTNIATGSGQDLPAILGSISMQDKDAVLILRKGKEFMAFPGPGGYKIEWSPGTRLLPMEAAPSGHLVIPCDSFEAAKPAGEDELSFVTDHSAGMH